MNNKRNYEYLLSDLSALKGIGLKTSAILRKKKINNIFDLLWKLPKSSTDRSRSSKIKDLRIGENQTVTIIPYKYSFPRITSYLFQVSGISWIIFDCKFVKFREFGSLTQNLL